MSDMPYIITRTNHVEHDVLSGGATDVILARSAVATLDEARQIVWTFARRGPAWRTVCIDHEAADWDGGTIGPLPDGTVIEVRRVPISSPFADHQAWCDIYNSKHAA